ncbi:MAG: MFS transporter, partial [Streptosporangiaceae bacterium]|nr:MFS transporter [Streptosporangiaceae bacterium]
DPRMAGAASGVLNTEVTVAMRNIDPRMAGAASGVLNTVRQVGLVIGTAAVGALLQNRLVSSMAAQAATRSAALPPRLRAPFLAGIGSSAKNGIQVGAGQSGGSTHLGPGLPARIAAEIARIAHDVFTFAYVTAMRETMVLPVILLGVGALSCLAIKQGKRAPEQAEAPKTETVTPA